MPTAFEEILKPMAVSIPVGTAKWPPWCRNTDRHASGILSALKSERVAVMGRNTHMREPKLTLGPDLVKLIAEIDEFKGKWEALKTLSPDRLNALRRIATIESIGSSTRIEGAKLTDAEVKDLLSQALSIKSFKTRDEQEVAGYAETMDLVFEAFADLRLTENHIRQLHQALLRHSRKDERHRGSYKMLPHHVLAFDTDGREIGVAFETTSPFETPREMEGLVSWTQEALDDELMHPLLIIAIFVVTFLAIHPFQDGNGRFSRVLTTLLLLRAKYAYVPYASLEHLIEENSRALLQGPPAHANIPQGGNTRLATLDPLFSPFFEKTKGCSCRTPGA